MLRFMLRIVLEAGMSSPLRCRMPKTWLLQKEMTRSDVICNPQSSTYAEMNGSDLDSPLILPREMLRHGVKGSGVGKMHG